MGGPTDSTRSAVARSPERTARSSVSSWESAALIGAPSANTQAIACATLPMEASFTSPLLFAGGGDHLFDLFSRRRIIGRSLAPVADDLAVRIDREQVGRVERKIG